MPCCSVRPTRLTNYRYIPSHVTFRQVADAHYPGVLTKPDRIPTGEEDGWIKMIQGHDDDEEGEIEYFSVKNPDSQDIKNGITYEQARQKEAEFFSTRAPWSSLDWPYQQRLGTEKLTRCLGQALADLISKRQVFGTLNSEVNWNVLVDFPNWRRNSTNDWSERFMIFRDCRTPHPLSRLER